MIIFRYFLEVFNWLLPKFLGASSGLFGSLMFLLIGMLLIAYDMSVYRNCNLGMVPYDSFSFIISERTGINGFVLRVIFDVTFAMTAIMVKRPISVGTILLAFGIGPLLKVMKRYAVNCF